MNIPPLSEQSPDYAVYGFREHHVDINNADPVELGRELVGLMDRQIGDSESGGVTLATAGTDGKLYGGSVYLWRHEPKSEGQPPTYEATTYSPHLQDEYETIYIVPDEQPWRVDTRSGHAVRRPAGAFCLSGFLEKVDNGRPYDPRRQMLVGDKIVSKNSLTGLGARIRDYLKLAFSEDDS